jgi:sugar lactone lactonase YvrE
MPKLEILLDRDLMFPEGLRWHDDMLWLSDMHRREVLRVAASGELETIVSVPNEPSGLGWAPDGSLLVVSMLDHRVKVLRGGELKDYADLSMFTGVVCNDMTVDGDGRAYVGCIDKPGADGLLAGRLVLVDVDGTPSLAADDVAGANGAVITADGATVIVAETARRRLSAWDRDDDGRLRNRRVWADCGEGAPDGICLDAEGAVWYADVHRAAAVRVLEGGRVTDQLPVHNGLAFACALGGERGTTLFVASSTRKYRPHDHPGSGSIECAEVSVPGVAWF